LVAHRYAILLLITVSSACIGIHDGGDWDLFVRPSVDVLIGRTGADPWSLYAEAPAVQIGPLALLVSAPLCLLGGWSDEAATLMVAASWVGIVALLERLAGSLAPDRTDRHARTAFMVGAVGAVLWHEMSHYRHLEDVLVLGATVVATLLVARRHPVGVGLALGVAAAAKPWGAGALPLVLALPRARDRAIAAAVAIAIAASSWTPFVVLDRRTVGALASFRLDVTGGSTLTLLGVDARTEMPLWVRPAQLLLALALGCLAVQRGRWLAVPLVLVSCRLLLEPASWPYYYAGLVAAAAVWDIAGSRRALPLWTSAVVFTQYDVRWLLNWSWATAVLNLACFVAMVTLVCWPTAVKAPPRLRAEPAGTNPDRTR
jgi:hypothetical protein